MTPSQIIKAVKPDDSHCPISRLLCLENTISGHVQNSGLNGLNEGQKVSYELEEQRNGKMAAVDLSVVE
jgi:hypothetical protein